jgi:hypothetical protein
MKCWTGGLIGGLRAGSLAEAGFFLLRAVAFFVFLSEPTEACFGFAEYECRRGYFGASCGESEIVIPSFLSSLALLADAIFSDLYLAHSVILNPDVFIYRQN